MMKRYIYISICFLSVWLYSCKDESLFSWEDNRVELAMRVSLPVGDAEVETRAGGTDGEGGLDYTTDAQRYIYKDDSGYDLYLLVYKKEGTDSEPVWKLKEVPEITLNGEFIPAEFRTLLLSAELGYSETDKVKFEILANLASSNCFLTEVAATSITTSEVKEKLEEMIGQTDEDVQKAVIFNHPADNWTLGGENQSKKVGHLPMSGKCTGEHIPNGLIDTDCDLYRSVAKIGVKVDEQCTNFTLKEVWLFYTNEQGYGISSKVPDANIAIQYTEPDVPANATKHIEPLTYTVMDNETIDEIAIAEVKNIGSNQPMVIMVGGIYEGEGLATDNEQLTYYRIDLKNRPINATEETGSEAYDIIRNHSYIYNIKKVANPGTITPDPTDKTATLEVEVMAYTEEPMKGINTQYTLEVDRNVFGFDGLCINALDLNIKTDGTTWKLCNEKGDDVPDWITLTDVENEHTLYSGRVTIIPTPNNTKETRTGYFYVQAGKIKKHITVIQEPAETANCYLITRPGTYLLQTNVKGNGTYKAWEGNKATAGSIDISFGNKGAKIEGIKSVKVIWETAKGLVTITNTDELKEGGNKIIEYAVHDVADLQWNASPFSAQHGGNALIGAFSGENGGGELLWSWHIWVVNDYKDGVKTEQWFGGYDFMDRYLGAYDNQPGSRSLGLLYQWGRKDPFIGAVRDHQERDYHTVPKVKTIHYFDELYWRDWGENDSETVLNSISRPTTLLKKGFLSKNNPQTGSFIDAENNTVKNHDAVSALWGTKSSSFNVEDNGVKTMYDPCPPGYRVPSVHAFVFPGANEIGGDSDISGEENLPQSTYNKNLWGNNIFVPRVKGEADKFMSDANFYGFYLKYNETAENVGTERTTMMDLGTRPKVYEHNDKSVDETLWGTLIPGQTEVTWLPLAGIYNGTIKHFGRIGRSSSAPKRPSSSLHMNSIIWLNAPSQADNQRPAGLFLHGTEGAYEPVGEDQTYNEGEQLLSFVLNDDGNTTWGDGYYTSDDGNEWKWNASEVTKTNINGGYEVSYSGRWTNNNYKMGDMNGAVSSGRHLHRLNERGADLLAGPQFAGSVRCIRDKDRVIVENNKIKTNDGKLYDGKPLTLNEKNKYTQWLVVSSVEDWHVIHPGAKWITVTPDNLTNSGTGDVTNISITAKTADAVKGDYTVVIKFSRGVEQKINLTVE